MPMDRPLTDADKSRYNTLNADNIVFLTDRYNRVNRWVIGDMIRRSAYHDPDKTALIFGDRTYTYAALEAECNRTANALRDLGVKKYDRVAILAHNTAHHVLTWIGCCKIGAVYLAINYLLRGKDITYCINHSEAKVFIVEDTLYDLVKDVLADMPGVKTFLWSNQGAGKPANDDRFRDFDAWIAPYPDSEPEAILHIEDPCQMTYTSGTESLPKGVEEVAVIGVDHPKWVEAVTAVVVPRQGETITEAEILDLCRRELAPFKVPKSVVFVSALPKTPTGKILKREMRQTYKTMFKESL
jgi:fatty-acyl-CoA synthase